MNHKRNLIVLALVLALASLVGVFFYVTSVTKVEALEVEKGGINVAIEETGYVEANDDYLIQAPGICRIININVYNGQEVEAGQVLMTLENLDLDEQLVLVNGQISNARTDYERVENNLEIALSDLEEFKKELERETKLFNAGAISQADYDITVNMVNKQENLVAAQQASVKGVESQLDSLTSQRDILDKKVQQFVITSQVSGRVLDIPVKDGQIAAAGTTLLEVANTGMLTVKTDLLSDDMANIRMGQNAEISSPVLNGKVLKGKVQEIYPKAFEKVSALGVLQRRVSVGIAIETDENLKPGYEVKVLIESLSRDNVLVIPWEAVRTGENGQNEVMLIANNKIILKPVKLGIKNQKDVEVVEGLLAGDRIVLDSSLPIKLETRVQIRDIKKLGR
ncbi:MAG: efflux RND transporter periplasmic adaptor subunit [Desulfotomaculaceae bacterium]|nr:efflux RND transporter periplasmic adaptor subunit [Desulfotomaculaceae bacterium]